MTEFNKAEIEVIKNALSAQINRLETDLPNIADKAALSVAHEDFPLYLTSRETSAFITATTLELTMQVNQEIAVAKTLLERL